jgi:hypothetical protein
MLRIARTTIIGLVLAGITLLSTQGLGQTGPRAREFTLVNTEINGVVIWLPSVIVVHAGEHVVLHLFNKLAAVHGLNIEDYDIHAVAYTDGGPNLPAGGIRQVEFVARKGLISSYYCQFHQQTHIGGEIIVLP